MSKIAEIKIGKGLTQENKQTGQWTRKYLELVVVLPEKDMEPQKTFHESLLRAEGLIDDWLKNGEVQKVPEFNPKLLTEHAWKGKNIGVHQWAPGSLSWGWDFKEQFPAEVIAVLEKGDLTIDGYVFSLGDKVVNVKKETAK